LRSMSVFSTMIMIAAPAAAQDSDVLGPVNPAEWVGGHTMPMAIDAQVRENRRAATRRNRVVSDRQTCREIPIYRAKLGASNPKIIRLTELCRRAGYR
jgi:hypothetical protein